MNEQPEKIWRKIYKFALWVSLGLPIAGIVLSFFGMAPVERIALIFHLSSDAFLLFYCVAHLLLWVIWIEFIARGTVFYAKYPSSISINVGERLKESGIKIDIKRAIKHAKSAEKKEGE